MPHALKVSVYFMVWFVAVSLIAFRNLPTVIGLGLLMAVAMILLAAEYLGERISFRLRRNRFGMVKREIALNPTRTCFKVDS